MHINAVGTLILILNFTFNLWILLIKIVIYLVGRKFHLHRCFRCLIWRSYRKWHQSRHLARNSVCNKEIYNFLIISCISMITKRILNSKNMPNGWLVYAFPIHAYFDVTSSYNLDSEKVLKMTKYITVFLRKIQRLKVFKIPRVKRTLLKGTWFQPSIVFDTYISFMSQIALHLS